jgi:hypothetical protein
MSRYLMGIVAVVALFAAATSEASAQLLEGLNDLLLGPLRSTEDETATEETTIPLEEAGRLVQQQAPIDPNANVGVTGDAIPSQGDTVPFDPNQPTIVPTQPTPSVVQATPAPVVPVVPETGEAPDSIPALW